MRLTDKRRRLDEVRQIAAVELLLRSVKAEVDELAPGHDKEVAGWAVAQIELLLLQVRHAMAEIKRAPSLSGSQRLRRALELVRDIYLRDEGIANAAPPGFQGHEFFMFFFGAEFVAAMSDSGRVWAGTQKGRALANANHDQPRGTRDRHAQVRAAWASGEYATKEACAEAMSAHLSISHVAASRALRGLPIRKRN